MFWRQLTDGDERAVRRPFDPADAAHGVALQRAIDVRKPPFVVLIDDRRRHALQIDLEHEVWPGIVPVIAVSHLDDNIVTVRAVDESFAGESVRQVLGLVPLGQPDIFGGEMERHRRRFALSATFGHDDDFPGVAPFFTGPTDRRPAHTTIKGTWPGLVSSDACFRPDLTRLSYFSPRLHRVRGVGLLWPAAATDKEQKLELRMRSPRDCRAARFVHRD